MNDRLEVDLEQFARDGFALVRDILTADEIAAGSPIFEERLPADKQPPGIPRANRNGRKTLIADHTDPRLSNLAGHPRLIAAVVQLTGPHFLINATSAPVITYKSPPGHERFDEGYHVDWPNNPPLSDDDRFINGVIHFTTVEPGGGAFMVRPGSHRLVADSLTDPTLRQRVLDQDFHNFPGLSDPVEMCVPAGSILFFHAFLVHDRSENVTEEPRKVLFTHYRGFSDDTQRRAYAADASSRFAQHHIDSMDSRMLQLCGLDYCD